MSRVVLVVPPFQPNYWPAIGASLLKALLAREGLPCDVLYLNVRFADFAGPELARELERGPLYHALIGEWLFAGDLFGQHAPNPRGYVEEVLLRPGRECAPALVGRLLELRERVPTFLDGLLVSYPWEACALVAVDTREDSPIRHNVPGLAVLRRIKAHQPGVATVMGGANCEGGVGAAIHEQFPFVDYVYVGEGDRVFPLLARRLLADEPAARATAGAAALPGVLARGGPGPTGAGERTPLVRDLDRLPYLDCDDYFEQFAGSAVGATTRPALALETARGCWWGEKHHCTFCGLNGDSMAYRAKSGRRALEELDYLADRHRIREVQVVDRILDPRYFKTLLRDLAGRTLPPRLFYETKSNLSKDQLRRLARAGARTFQPGVESLSTSILRLMDKGATGLQNIRLLKWCAAIGIEPAWNLLYGFPGEDPAEYERMAELVPWLGHLQPPLAVVRIRLDRFSPNFDQAAARGLADVRPLAPYRHVYPLAPEALARLAYYFDFRYADGRDPHRYAAGLRQAAAGWQTRAGQARLDLRSAADRLEIEDTRPAAARPRTILRGPARLAYLALDAGATARGVATALERESAGAGEVPSIEQIERWLAEWERDHLALREGDRYLSLAVDPTERVQLPAECFAAALAGVGS